MNRYYAAALLAAALTSACAEDSEEPIAPSADQTVLQALPKVPTMETIAGKGDSRRAPSKWIQELMKKKETRARIEIVSLKQKVLAEQEATLAADKERSRRQERYNAAYGSLNNTSAPSSGAGERRKRTLNLKLEFQVPEMEVYRRLIEAYKIRAALAADAVNTLTRLDRNGDGNLSSDEYRDAAYLWTATTKLFHPVDSDLDGYISVAEIEAARTLPANGAAAITAGANSKEAINTVDLKIKDFDQNNDGILNVAERKALSSAYLEASLRAQQDAAAYQNLLDELLVARQTSTAKFENLTIEAEEAK
jgi:Ca2+-binding EF-hand superfamily protein